MPSPIIFWEDAWKKPPWKALNFYSADSLPQREYRVCLNYSRQLTEGIGPSGVVIKPLRANVNKAGVLWPDTPLMVFGVCHARSKTALCQHEFWPDGFHIFTSPVASLRHSLLCVSVCSKNYIISMPDMPGLFTYSVPTIAVLKDFIRGCNVTFF